MFEFWIRCTLHNIGLDWFSVQKHAVFAVDVLQAENKSYDKSSWEQTNKHAKIHKQVNTTIDKPVTHALQCDKLNIVQMFSICELDELD